MRSFIATSDDLEPGIRMFESSLPIRYVAQGFHSKAGADIFIAGTFAKGFVRTIDPHHSTESWWLGPEAYRKLLNGEPVFTGIDAPILSERLQ